MIVLKIRNIILMMKTYINYMRLVIVKYIKNIHSINIFNFFPQGNIIIDILKVKKKAINFK